MALTYIIPAIATVIIGAIADYFLLPAWSIHNPGIYILLIIFAGIYFGVHLLMCRFKETSRVLGSAISLGIAATLLLVLLVGAVSSWSLFHAKAYANILGDTIVETEITNLVISLEDAGLLDKEAAEQIAQQELSTLGDQASRFVTRSSSQISYNGAPTRIIPLDYKGFKERKGGDPAYITVDMRTQEAEIHYVEQPVKYTPGAILGKDLLRHLHYKYPTYIFAWDPQFEIDDTGKPFYVVPVAASRISLFGGRDVSGIVTVDPCSGDTEYYDRDAAPEWIDHVYPAELIVKQFNDYGKHQDGGVASTAGYNYVNDGHNVYVYTGVTSAASNELNIGFLFTNLHTKETRYYPLSGADERSAMDTAASTGGAEYTASFPWMLPVEGTPTYCMALKDSGGGVRMYAMVNVNKPHLVTVGSTREECQTSYRNLVLSNDVTITPPPVSIPAGPQAGSITGRIQDIRTGDKNGTTYFYLKLENQEVWYVVSLTDNEEAIKLNTTDTVVLDVGTSGSAGPIIQAKLKSYTEGAPWWENN